MIVSDRASLCIYSDSMTTAEITAVMGIEPTEAHEKGDPTRAGLAGRPLKPKYLAYQQTYWCLDMPEDDFDPEDSTGFAHLAVLVERLRGKESALTSLRPACETIIWWSGDSDSTQGGFVLTAELTAQLAALGCDLYGTTYLDDPSDAP